MRRISEVPFRGAVRSKRFLVLVWYPLALSIVAAGLIASVHFFPGPFDWRYRVVSSLMSPVDNPGGNTYFCAALSLAFALLLPLPAYFRARLAPGSPRLASFSFHALRVGFVFGVLVGAERLFFPQLSGRIHKAHEYLALVAFAGAFLGVVGFWIAFTQSWRAKRRAPDGAIFAFSLFSAAPMIGAATSQAYLYFVPNKLGWVSPKWAELGVPLYLSFAVWEWLASVGVFAYLYLLLVLLPADEREAAQRPAFDSHS